MWLICGAKGIRTPDLFHAMEARYQLRHSPALVSEQPEKYSVVTGYRTNRKRGTHMPVPGGMLEA